MNASTHPAEAYVDDVAGVQIRARFASLALMVTVLVRLLDLPVRQWQSMLLRDIEAGLPPARPMLELSDSLVRDAALAQAAAMVVTGILFLYWLHRVVRLTIAFGGTALTFSPKDAVTGFVIPFLNFTRPYQIVRDVHDTLEPDAVPEPTVQVQAGEMLGYRNVSMTAPPPPAALPHAWIGAWWGFFWVGNVIANLAARTHANTASELLFANGLNGIADVVELISATLAVLMVRGITARLVERFRRVRHNPIEVLDYAAINVG